MLEPDRDGRATAAGNADVATAFDLLLQELADEVRAVRAQLAGAPVEELEARTARVKALSELKDQVESLRTRYSKLMEPPPPPDGVTCSLGRLASGNTRNCPATRGKPLHISFPDGTSEAVTQWKDLAVAVCTWLGRRRQVPIPFAGRERSRLYFINREPVHANGMEFARSGRRNVRTERQEFWIDTHRSASDLLRCLTHLITACNESPDRFEVTYRPGRQRGRRQKR